MQIDIGGHLGDRGFAERLVHAESPQLSARYAVDSRLRRRDLHGSADRYTTRVDLAVPGPWFLVPGPSFVRGPQSMLLWCNAEPRTEDQGQGRPGITPRNQGPPSENEDADDRSGAHGRRGLHDLHDARAAGQLRPDRPFRRAAGLHAVQCRDASGRPGQGRAALRLPPPQASLQRQVHARRRSLRADLLRAVDDHGRGARAPVSGDRRSRTTSRPTSRCCRSTRWASAAAPAR